MVKKKIVSFVVGICLLFNAAPVWAADGEPELLSTSPITSGAVLKDYFWNTVDGPVKLSVIEADLSNEYLEVELVLGEGKLGQRSNVSAMAARTGAAAAVNGDLYNTKGEGSPISTTLIDGELVTSPCVIPGIYALGITEDNVASIEQFDFSGTVTAQNGVQYPISGLNKAWYWEFPVGVHSHVDKLHIYSDKWGANTRGQDEYAVDIAEVLVKDGVVTAISPEGYFPYPVPEGAYILRAQGQAKAFLLDNLHVGERVRIDYQITPDKNWETIIGGDGLLVDNGQMVEYTKSTEGLNGVRARTAAGISKDGRTLYLVAVQGRTADSVGLTLGNLSLFMTKIGAWQAINLDGGGSTTMVSRPLGEFETQQAIAVESRGAERKVVEGIGLYSTAPIGRLSGLILSGETRLLVGESAEYQVKGYDEYYNPLRTSTLALNYGDSKGLGAWQGNRFTPAESGATILSVANGAVKATLPIEVIGKDRLSALDITVSDGMLIDGGVVQLEVTATLKDGTSKTVSPQVLNWQVEGFDGSVDANGVLTIQSTEGNDSGTISADYEGFVGTLAVEFEETEGLNLLNSLDGLSFEKTPAAVSGGLSVVPDPAGGGSNVVRLEYQFGQETASTAAYMRFDGGIPLAGTIDTVALDVYGAGGGEWLRAELLDANGQVQRVDLTRNVDWQGWRQVSFQPQALGFDGPLTLQRIYVVETENPARNQTAPKRLYFRNLQTIGQAAGANAVILQIGSTEMNRDGQTETMDVAPQLINDRTMVPVRFISEAFGAQTQWRDEDSTAVVVMNGTIVELPVGSNEMRLNGQSIAIDVPAQLVNDRTMVPLRAISEGLGMTVDYDGATQSIYIVR